MLKEKGLYTVVTFPNTTAALAMEAACKAQAIPGSIIPVPNQITAGCGFAWRADAGAQEQIEGFLADQGLAFTQVHTIEL